MNDDRFFWFDPFGEAPEGAVVTGLAGGSIWWGSGGSYPEMQARSSRIAGEWLAAEMMEQSSFLRALRRDRDPPAGFQFGVGEPRPPEESARIEIKRRYVVKDLPNG